LKKTAVESGGSVIEEGGDDFTYSGLGLSVSEVHFSKPKPTSIAENIWSFLRSQVGLEPASGTSVVKKTLKSYTLYECATQCPDEIIIRATKREERSSYGLKYFDCDSNFQVKVEPRPVIPPASYQPFVEPYILYNCFSQAIVRLAGIIEHTGEDESHEGWKAWKPRLHAPSQCGYFMSLEWSKADLLYYSATRSITPKNAGSIALQLFEALSYLHSHGVVHRSVAPWNIRVADGRHGNSIFLAGFSTACTPEGDPLYIPKMPGPNSYSAPEMFSINYSEGLMKTNKEFWMKYDVWAAACIVAEILVGTRGRPLFKPRLLYHLANGGVDAARKMMAEQPGMYSHYPVLACVRPGEPGTSPEYRNNYFIAVEDLSKMVSGLDYLDRSNIALAEIISDVLVADPSQRPSAEEIAEQISERCVGAVKPAVVSGRKTHLVPITESVLKNFAKFGLPFFFLFSFSFSFILLL